MSKLKEKAQQIAANTPSTDLSKQISVTPATKPAQSSPAVDKGLPGRV